MRPSAANVTPGLCATSQVYPEEIARTMHLKPLDSLVLGTHNRKKLGELADLIEPLGISLLTLAEFPQAIQVEETGTTFAENARLKAVEQARHLKAWVLGEDSGLCVAELGDAPGVYSARYAGESATDADNNRKLLAALDDVPLERRSAHYVCYAVLSDPTGNIRAESRGECHGRILASAAGTGGFGYDPLFEVVEYHQTFGLLPAALKSCISHRARAIRQLLPQLARLHAAG